MYDNTYNQDAKKAILLWRNKEWNKNNNLNNIKLEEIKCSFRGFIYFSILYKNRNLEHYRNEYNKITGKHWQNATIQDILNAELVWGI